MGITALFFHAAKIQQVFGLHKLKKLKKKGAAFHGSPNP